MKRKYIKAFALLASGLTASAVIPFSATSCSINTKKIDNNYYDDTVVAEYEEQFNLMEQQINNALDKLGDTDIEGQFDTLIDDIKAMFNEALEQASHIFKDMDPVDILQQVLVEANKDGKLSHYVNDICECSFIKNHFDIHTVEGIRRTLNDILDGKTSLKWVWKHYCGLNSIFENILYPLFGNDREKAWEAIYSVYSDAYYLGLNINHKNGQVITYDPNDVVINQEKDPSTGKMCYDKYDWASVRPGDIVFSESGFELAGHASGHCAIVENTAAIDRNGNFYIRVIESNQYGVQYGLVDDYRIQNDKLHIFHINASIEQAAQAVEFAKSQIGADYSLPLLLSQDTSKETDAWYCSELVWAAYKNLGINIQDNEYYQYDIPGILPWEIYYTVNKSTDTIDCNK